MAVRATILVLMVTLTVVASAGLLGEQQWITCEKGPNGARETFRSGNRARRVGRLQRAEEAHVLAARAVQSRLFAVPLDDR